MADVEGNGERSDAEVTADAQKEGRKSEDLPQKKKQKKENKDKKQHAWKERKAARKAVKSGSLGKMRDLKENHVEDPEGECGRTPL